ncbi:MAG: putative transposase [Gammaproteobacteria bacterium]|jgi:putative transposase
MLTLQRSVLGALVSALKGRRALAFENLAPRQQVALVKRSVRRPRVARIDGLLWIAFARYVDHWRAILHALHPDTVVPGHREGFRRYWARKSRRVGRPAIAGELRALIRTMQAENPPGAHPESMGNASNPDLIYLKRRSPSSWRRTETRRLNAGVPFSQRARELR